MTTFKPLVASGVMDRAWTIFRNTYSYPQISFQSIGRHCFRWALASAWAEARAAAALSATSLDTLVHRCATIRSELDGLKYRPFSVNIGREELRLSLALSILIAEIERRPAPLALAA